LVMRYINLLFTYLRFYYNNQYLAACPCTESRGVKGPIESSETLKGVGNVSSVALPNRLGSGAWGA